MGWDPKNEEIQAILRLPGSKRYEYFLKHVVDEEKIWSLWDDGWALAIDNEGNELIPVWPHFSFATICATDNWAKYQPMEIPLSVWIEKWIPGMKNDRRNIVVFPTLHSKGVIIDPDRFYSDVQKLLEMYE